jgi:pyruvate dehydrogenase E1 component alpha subunit
VTAVERTAQRKGSKAPKADGDAQREHELPPREEALGLLDTMLLIRHFEERAQEMYMKAKIGGFLHLAVGEEATVVGTTSALKPQDYLLSTYREHGQALARGTDPKAVMAELFGREGGVSRGRGGSMHLFDADRRFLGGYGIVGGNLPLAAGVALASDYRGDDAVTLCMFGDGASNQGTFGETMNLAALWKLPVVFLVVNNQYGMGTALARHSAVTDLSSKAECLGVPGDRVDGMDVLAVRECVAEHLRHAREERQPTLIEALTYRFRGHSAADPEVYRTKEEVQLWRERDPIVLYGDRLKEAGFIDDAGISERDRRAIEIVDAAVAFAEQSPEPALESLYDDIYVLGDQVQGWYSVDERTPEVHRGEDEHEIGAHGVAHELAEAGAAYAGAGEVQKRRRAQEHGASAAEPAEGLDGPADTARGTGPSPAEGANGSEEDRD